MPIPLRHRLAERRFLRPAIFAIAVGMLAATAASRASAKEPALPPQGACGDTTCAYGFTCQVIPGACPLIACRDGEACPPCAPQDSYVCAPSSCATDADCGAFMVCAPLETTQCSVSPPAEVCAPNTDCSPPATTDPAGATSNCTTTTYHQCTPRWQLPCQTAADCGAGFTCDEQQSCGCSGGGSIGGGATPSSGSSTPPAMPQAPPNCTCTGTGTSACAVIPTVCDTDAECLPGWTCQVIPSVRSCTLSPDGQPSCDPPPAVTKNCAPPYSSPSGATVDGTPTAPGHEGAKAADAASNWAGCAMAGSEHDSSRVASLLGLIMIAAAWLTRHRRHRANSDAPASVAGRSRRR